MIVFCVEKNKNEGSNRGLSPRVIQNSQLFTIQLGIRSVREETRIDEEEMGKPGIGGGGEWARFGRGWAICCRSALDDGLR